MLSVHLSPQISPAHCGPAVLQALLRFYGYESSQEQIVAAAGADEKISEYGTTYLDLQKAAAHLAPDLTFHFQQNSGLPDLKNLVVDQKTPIAVEWQGFFDSPATDPSPDEGHYSVVVNTSPEFIYLLDPYQSPEGQLLTLEPGLFLERWRETTEIPQNNPRFCQILVDYHLLFYLKPSIDTTLGSGSFF